MNKTDHKNETININHDDQIFAYRKKYIKSSECETNPALETSMVWATLSV